VVEFWQCLQQFSPELFVCLLVCYLKKQKLEYTRLFAYAISGHGAEGNIWTEEG
jgi:hypothetical protein